MNTTDPKKPETFVESVLTIARWAEQVAEWKFRDSASERDEYAWLLVVRARERIEESRETERLIDCRRGDRHTFMPSAELLALAKRAVAAVAARGEVNVEEWAKQLAADVADADD